MTDTPKLSVELKEGKMVVVLKEVGHMPRQIKHMAFRCKSDDREFVKRWQRIAISNYYEFDNRTGVLI